MAHDPARELVDKLRAKEGKRISTSSLGRLQKTATAAARVGMDMLAGRLRGDDFGLGRLSPEALAKMVESFGELKGVAMKLGQILSYVDLSLSPETRRMLSVLQTMSQPAAFSEVLQTIREDLGVRGRGLLSRLEREPVASASIGQVHRSVLDDGTQVAVKVRHPGIVDAIRADFKTAALGTAFARLTAPGLNLEEVLTEAKARFLEECDYALEARRQSLFQTTYAEHPFIAIPVVHPSVCGPRVLTSTWHDGLGLEAFLTAAPFQSERVRASRALYEFYVGTLYRHGLFNADPHPGNLLFQPDGRITIFDHGCVREFDRDLVAGLVRLSRAVRADDARATQAALSAIGMFNPLQDFDITRSLLRGFYAPLLASGHHAVTSDHAISIRQVVKMKKAILHMRLPGKLMFLFRIRIGLYAVLARIGARLDWQALEDELAESTQLR